MANSLITAQWREQEVASDTAGVWDISSCYITEDTEYFSEHSGIWDITEIKRILYICHIK